ncbi:MAG: carotenoid oxygenase family protein [Myxococcota bacterium]
MKRVRRREFMHLLGAQGVGLGVLSACGDDGSGGTGAGSSGSSGVAGSSDGGEPGTGSSGAMGSTSGLDSSGSMGGESSSEGSTGEDIDECDTEAWWLVDNYAPVEESEATDLPVEGTVPAALEGLYVRNGPNPLSGCTEHWFLGDGMVHGVQLGGGTAQWYRSRYIDTPQLGADKLGDPFDVANHRANTSLVVHDGRLLAIEETGLPYELNADLATVGLHDFGGAVSSPMCAHPKIDPTTGEMVFFGYDLIDPRARLRVVDAKGALMRSEEIALPAPIMMHDFQITANYVVFMDLPILFDLDLVAAGATLPFSWQPSNGARIGLMPRNGGAGDVIWAEIEVGFAFHTFNAHEDAMGNVVLDAVWYPDLWATGTDEFSDDSTVERFTINPTTGTASRQLVDDRQSEFPRTDPRRQGLHNRYGYAISLDPRDKGRPPLQSTLVRKYDFETGMVQTHQFADGLELSELVFVPDSPGAGEDEGWLVGYGYDPKADRSQLVIMDATNLRAGPVGRVMLPGRVPHGFHGTWWPS